MSAPNRALKARGKASVDRIQSNIENSFVIKNGAVCANAVIHFAADEDLNIDAITGQASSVPLAFFLENKDAIVERVDQVTVQIASDESPEELLDYLKDISGIVLTFVNFVDGRGYSHANKLRTRYGFEGEIRAVGDVHYDQIAFLARSGCDAFELPDSEDAHAALAALEEFSEVYQPAADNTDLIFSRRRTKH
jgi:uncharacterized protein (DUF934 family)